MELFLHFCHAYQRQPCSRKKTYTLYNDPILPWLFNKPPPSNVFQIAPNPVKFIAEQMETVVYYMRISIEQLPQIDPSLEDIFILRPPF